MGKEKVYTAQDLEIRKQRWNMVFVLCIGTCAALLQLISSNISSIRESQALFIKEQERQSARIMKNHSDMTDQKVSTADLRARVNSLEKSSAP